MVTSRNFVSVNCVLSGKVNLKVSGFLAQLLGPQRLFFSLQNHLPQKMTTITLPNGVKMPIVGLGTFQSKPGEVGAAVETAIDVGYRHIDTAAFYQNEKEIGDAMKKKIDQGVIKRSDMFITTKLSLYLHSRSGVAQSVQESLGKLGTTYVDLFLMHSPCSLGEVIDYIETWKGMEDAYKAGLVKAIGISNFNPKQIERLMGVAEVKPMNLQVEANVHFHQKELHDFCKKLGISFTAYAPLGSPGFPGMSPNPNKVSVLDDPIVKSIAAAHKKAPAHVAIRYLIQRQMLVIPKSISPGRIKDNFQVFDFQLTEDEMKKLNDLPDQDRLFAFSMIRDNPHYPY